MNNSEVAIYFAMADPDTVRTCLDCYKKQPWRGQHAAAECAYIVEHHALPAWARVIERFEIIDGNLLFIHADPDLEN